MIRHLNAARLPDGYPVDEHFNPSYGPWDQRLCVVPDGNMFDVISRGKGRRGDRPHQDVHRTGIELESGLHLDADIIVTATGLNIQLFGGCR